MNSLRYTLEYSHQVLDESKVRHALIGGFALAALGIARTTHDVDYLIDETQKEMAKTALIKSGWRVAFENAEVIHFREQGNVDLLLARRPLSLKMLSAAKTITSLKIKCISPEGIIGLKIQAYKNDPEREFQDKADIQALIQKFQNSLDWKEIEIYADLFGESQFINKLRKKE